jgi:hypothetical protein
MKPAVIAIERSEQGGLRTNGAPYDQYECAAGESTESDGRHNKKLT